MRLPILLLACLAAGPALAQAPAAAPPLRLELNRLEEVDGGCRVYLVAANEAPVPLDSLKLDLVLFGKDGVVERRLAVEAGPLRAAKTTVKLFDLADYPCGRLGSVLLNDLMACSSAGRELPDCFERLALATRTPVPFSR
jgi:hypothetical protein